MTKNEVSIEQLNGIAGGGTFTGNAFRLDKSSTKSADRNQLMVGCMDSACFNAWQSDVNGNTNLSTFLPRVGYLAGLGDICA